MPKLPKDENLFTPAQQAHFNRKCECGYAHGLHKAEGLNCPGPTSPGQGRQWMERVFRVAASTNFDRLKAATSQEAETWVHGFRVGDLVKFGALREPRRVGRVVEIVAKGALPTIKGLRHITDKRRQPKPRDVVSYIVQDPSHGAPSRTNLYWPGTFGLEAV